MKVLVVGKGGREHALCWRLAQSPSVSELFCAEGNPGTAQIAATVPIAAGEIEGLRCFAQQERIDLCVVGPEQPLVDGIVDEFERYGLRIFGPSKAAATLEGSKSFARLVMRQAGVPMAEGESFDDSAAARDYVLARRTALVVKADGLAMGKGVAICEDREQALDAVARAMDEHRFGAAGSRLVIEERLKGEELSFFALCDGERALPLGIVQDHKAIYDGDHGPNTGGMGAYSPVPQFGRDLEDRVMREVINPTLAAMSERGTPFRGVLFAGLMVSGERLNVLEFNVRFGDPECESLMMRFEGDLAETLLQVAEGRLTERSFGISPRSAATVVLTSGGYPDKYRTGLPIRGLERIEGSDPSAAKVGWALKRVRLKIFHAGTALAGGQLLTAGGRVLAVTAGAAELHDAIATAYEAADMIEFEGKHLRRDIGRRALQCGVQPVTGAAHGS